MLGYPLRSNKSQILFSRGGFLEGDPIDTYERMKTIFGYPINEKTEITSLLLSYQNESIKEIKASLDANFRNILNLSSTINGHVLCQNRNINSIDNKFSLFFSKTKYGNTQIYPRFYAQLGALNDSACWEATQFYFVFFCFWFCLGINNPSRFCLDVVLSFNQCLCQVEPIG